MREAEADLQPQPRLFCPWLGLVGLQGGISKTIGPLDHILLAILLFSRVVQL